jgi:hypothetical protein
MAHRKKVRGSRCVTTTAIVIVVTAARIPVDAYVFDALLPDLVGHDRRPSAFLVYLWLWRRTRGGKAKVVASLRMIADGTGLSKGSVQTAISWLERRALVETKHRTPTSAPHFALRCHWRTEP